MAERLAFDAADPRLAAAAWSRLIEPGDQAAGALVTAVGAVPALDWLCSGAHMPPGLPPHPGWAKAAAGWRPRLRGLDPRRELEVLERLGGVLVLPGEPGWPAGLADLGQSAPPCLWVRGDPDSLRPGSVAVVGARASTGYGERVAADLALGAADAGVCVVSGGAFGIDAAAHRAALAAGGATIAFLAGGVDRLYPVANTDLLLQVAATAAVVSEAPPGTSPMRQRFLQRNRLIAAIAQATVVVEAGWRSGALNTAHRAGELLRPVGAVPGPVTSMASAGCHRLLREGVATCVTDAAEMLELAGGLCADRDPAAGRQVREGLLDDLGEADRQVLDALPARGAARTDPLVRAAGMSPGAVMAALGRLELAGRVSRVEAGWRRRQ